MDAYKNIKSWAVDLEPQALLQAERTARLPILAGPLALMPDAHYGIGATVGSVIATRNAIIPAAVGVDIGCGMIATRLNLSAEDLPDSLGPFMAILREHIPAGMGKGYAEGDVPSHVARWMFTHPAPVNDMDDRWDGLSSRQWKAALNQLGSLGSGNHFLEICLDELSRVWIVLHSGSRGVGNQLAMQHIGIARKMSPLSARDDQDLQHFTEGTDAFDAYIADMLWAQDYAAENRTIMMKRAEKAFLDFIGKPKSGAVDTINCHHNFAQQETWFGEKIWITRKGAIQAFDGARGVIPGSMGTSSFIVTGKGNVDSWSSSAHGAGRAMSRTAAKKIENATEKLVAAMGDRVWNSHDVSTLIDEAPEAYKDIHRVMAQQADLVTIDHELTQILNYKGTGK